MGLLPALLLGQWELQGGEGRASAGAAILLGDSGNVIWCSRAQWQVRAKIEGMGHSPRLHQINLLWFLKF